MKRAAAAAGTGVQPAARLSPSVLPGAGSSQVQVFPQQITTLLSDISRADILFVVSSFLLNKL